MSERFVEVSELKRRLSHYLRRARRGATVLVCNRGRVVARLVPADDGEVFSDDAAWITGLERRGTLRRATATLPRMWLAHRPTVRADVVRALLDERTS